MLIVSSHAMVVTVLRGQNKEKTNAQKKMDGSGTVHRKQEMKVRKEHINIHEWVYLGLH